MKRVSKVILIGLAVLVMLGVALIVGLNAYVRSAGTRARIQAQLSDALGLPIELTTISVGIGGVHVHGVRIPSGERNLLEALSFAADYRIFPLFSHRLVIQRMRLDSPKVIWAQNAEGKWVLPLLPAREDKAKLPNAPGPQQNTTAKKQTPWEVTIDRLEIANGSIELLDAEQKRVAIASGVNMQYRISRWDDVQGTISAAQVLWLGAPSATEFHSPLRYSQGALTLEGMQAQVAGGTVQGTATVQTDSPDSPYSIQLTLDRLELARVATEMGSDAEKVSGPLSGTVEATGQFADSTRLKGKGHLTMADGRLRGFPLWDSVADSISLVLPLPNLADVSVRTGQTDFRFAYDKIKVDALALENTELRVTATGTINTEGKVDLDAQLTVQQKIVDQIQKVARSIFSMPDSASRQTTDFKIYGQLDKPKTDLGKRFVEQQIGDQLGDLFSRLTKKPVDKQKEKEDKEREKKERKEKKKADEAARAAAGMPAPTEPAPAAPESP